MIKSQSASEYGERGRGEKTTVEEIEPLRKTTKPFSHRKIVFFFSNRCSCRIVRTLRVYTSGDTLYCAVDNLFVIGLAYRRYVPVLIPCFCSSSPAFIRSKLHMDLSVF